MYLFNYSKLRMKKLKCISGDPPYEFYNINTFKFINLKAKWQNMWGTDMHLKKILHYLVSVKMLKLMKIFTTFTKWISHQELIQKRNCIFAFMFHWLIILSRLHSWLTVNKIIVLKVSLGYCCCWWSCLPLH